MDIDSLIADVQTYDKFSDINLIRKAYEFSKKAHNGQKRDSGEEYLVHPFGVAEILVDLKADGASICTAFLHDVVEDSGTDVKTIEKEFGNEIAGLVESLTKTSKISFESYIEYNAENLRRMLLATTRDIRVIIIKLADRLHNMQTLKFLSPEQQIRISRETLEIYAPLARKLGMYSLMGQLEDLALRYTKPEVHDFLKTKVNERREEREKKAELVIAALQEALQKEGIDVVDISGRAKYFHSIYAKMMTDKKSFEEIYDLIAMRIIVRNIEDCYKVIAIVHQMWRPIPGRFKDYIAVPKSNGYQSLHTDVATPFGTTVEVQARTVEMDNIARYGVAAHWRYKGTERDKQFDKRISWLEQILEWKRNTPHEFLESLKVDLFQDEIVVFTPKGDPIILPAGATAIDFAYEVHSDVGDHCLRAEVNKKVVALDYQLKGGDIINIMTAKTVTAARHWLNIVITHKAKQKIKSTLGIESEERVIRKHETEERIDAAKYISCDEKGDIKSAKCCSLKFQDEIIAFKTKDGFITVHARNCSNVASLDQSKLVKASWNVLPDVVKTLYVYVEDEYGLVKKVLDNLIEHAVTVLSVNMRPHHTVVAIALKIKSDNENHVKEVEHLIGTMPHVMSVRIEPIQ